MVRERGSGKTPQRVVERLKEAIAEKGLIGLENATGVGKSALSRYAKGIGEPTTATLQKLADYFDVSVAWLRGGDVDPSKVIIDQFKTEISEMLQIDKEIAGALITVVIFGALSLSDKSGKTDNYEHEQSALRYIFSRFKPVFELKSQRGKSNTIDLPQNVIDSTISEILYPGLSDMNEKYKKINDTYPGGAKAAFRDYQKKLKTDKRKKNKDHDS